MEFLKGGELRHPTVNTSICRGTSWNINNIIEVNKELYRVMFEYWRGKRMQKERERER